MPYSVGEAARATGRNKTTISRAIKSGKLSATHNPDGSYSIDPAELHRVFPFDPATSDATVAVQPYATDDATAVTVAVLEERVRQLEERLHETETQRDQWHNQAERLTRLLTAPQTEQPTPPAPNIQPLEEPAETTKPRPWWKLW
jgi:hypothetical protein